MMRQVCPTHSSEEIVGVLLGEDTAYTFTCDRTDHHPRPNSPHSWMDVPEPRGIPATSGLAQELGLHEKLPDLLSQFRGRWVEYGVLERAYALSKPADFALLVDRYGHTARAKTHYSASSFIAHTLGGLARQGAVLLHDGPATGRWSHLSRVSWWALAPEPNWDDRLPWAATGYGTDYVPGSLEQ